MNKKLIEFSKTLFLISFYSFASVGRANEIYAFPKNFLFGVATASYQVEGAWNTSGKGESSWDNYAHNSQNIKDGSNGDIACDSYHKFKDDVQLIKSLGVDVYRFSLSWPRILPTGFASQINPDGIRYYNELIDELLSNGIEPFVTIFHWDLPQPLMELGGWANPLMANFYNDFANVSFHYFGSKVKFWMTFNEPSSFCSDGYEFNAGPPKAAYSKGIGFYLCSHTVLRSHALAYKTYTSEYKHLQGGKVGIVIDSRWYEPKTNKTEDIEAAARILEFTYGIYVNPIVNGDYPDIMRSRVDEFSRKENFPFSRLPKFTPEEKALLRGSFDFLGLNHYSTSIASNDDSETWPVPSYSRDIGVVGEYDPNWENTTLSWLHDVPWGMYKLLMYIRDKYNNPPIYITENGFVDPHFQDVKRIQYLKGYLKSVSDAIQQGCDVRGYITWSLMDNFEWGEGYTQKFGLCAVDFTNPSLPRNPRASFLWFYWFIRSQRDTNAIQV